MEKLIRPDKSQKILISGGIIIMLILGAIAYAIAQDNLIPAVIATFIPFTVGVLIIFYRYPVSLLYVLLIYGFLLTIFERYLKIPSPGLAQDFIIVFLSLIIFLKAYSCKFPWRRLRIPLLAFLFTWITYCILEIFNTNANSIVPWFWGIRNCLYMLFIPLALVLIERIEHLNWFLVIFCLLSVLVTLYGCVQKFIGLNATEHALMAAGMAKNHYVFGNLRVFSFLNDAGVFGSSQACVGIMSLFIALVEKRKKIRFLLLIAGVCGLYGMAISGTRGAIFIPFAAAMCYLFVKKNIKVLILGGLIIGCIFYGLKYTYIGQSNYTVRRMRSSFDTEDASLQVRLANQQLLRGYMKSRPFGEGLGSTGEYGEQYSPDSLVANTATDSGYVDIWAQTGIVGLVLYIGLWMFILIKGCFIIWGLKNSYIKGVMTAFLCGIFGLLVANYGNSVINRYPISYAVYFCVAFIFLSPVLEKQIEDQTKQNATI
jgi:hypothetical protein